MTSGSPGGVRTVWVDPQYRRWIGWITLAVAFALFSFHRVSTTVITDDLMRAFAASGAELGILHSSLFYIYALMQVPAGIIIDRHGTRRVATTGSLIMGIGVVGFAIADTYLLSFLGRAIIGLGGSVLYISTLRYCAVWYRSDEFATMTGLTSAMAGIGGMVATVPLAILVSMAGWRTSLFAIGVFGVGVAAAVFGLVRDSPGAANLQPIREVPEPEHTSLRAVLQNARRVLADRATWMLGGIFLCFIGTTFTVLGLWGVPFIVDRYGLSVQRASQYVFVGNLGFLLGPPALGWVSDRLNVRTPIIAVSGAVFAFGYGSIALLGRPPLLLIGVIFFTTTFVGGAGFITFSLVKERHSQAASGSATGAVNSLGFVGVAILPAVMGWLLDIFWTGETIDGARVYTALGYRAAFAVAGLMGIIALGMALWYWRAPPPAQSA